MTNESKGETGYQNPPKEHQFKPGQSGNPKGRTAGARGLKTDLNAELKSRHALTVDGKIKRFTKQQLVVKALINKAIKGDVKAAAQVLSLCMNVIGVEDERVGKSQVSAADLAVLADYMASLSGSSEPPADWPPETAKTSNHGQSGDPSPPASDDDDAVPESDDDEEHDVSENDDVNDEFDDENYDEEDYDDD